MSAPDFDREEEQRISERLSLRADEIFEVVRRQGDEELGRPAGSLAWSGLAAGLAIGFSVIAEAAILARVPSEAGWASLVGDMGYTVGFILVVLGRLQLFTENTITPVMPICYAPTRANFAALARIWSIVLGANMVGATLFAVYVMKTGAVSEEVREGVLALGRHAAHGTFGQTIVQGIGAGFLIAALVWILAGMKSGQLAIVFLITYVIALAEFAHVIAGTVEIAALVLEGAKSLADGVFGFLLPALIGNVIGGTILFTLIAYGQIRRELPEK